MSLDEQEPQPRPEDRIFPRNLTARAAYVVAGNPVVSRPESGVDNTHPGLEFDKRNLDRDFFPGLRFDFQFKLGAKLSKIFPDRLSSSTGLTQADLDPGLFLWAVMGHFGDAPAEVRKAYLLGVDGYDVLRKVHDLEPGWVAVVVGRPNLHPDQQAIAGKAAMATCDHFFTGAQLRATTIRGDDGKVEFAVLYNERARYLDADGVIDTQSFEPGMLTESLCSPWQWDFADCGCYYWAASRPDIVMDVLDGDQVRNYQRRPGSSPPDDPKDYAKWMAGTIDQVHMITTWQKLPIVIGETERPDGVAMLWQGNSQNRQEKSSFDDVAAQFAFLATVEHAVCVLFLYAHYSVDVSDQGDAATPVLRRVAAELMRMAREEMQHLRWVNDALQVLGREPSLGRADSLKMPGHRAVDSKVAVSLSVQPLTDEAIDTFIRIESPSRNSDPGRGPTGLYVELLEDLEALDGDPSSKVEPVTLQRLKELVKLLIDEGGEHAKQLRFMQALVKPVPLERRLRVTTVQDPASWSPDAKAQQADADAFYARMLKALSRAYSVASISQEERKAAIRESRNAMQSIDKLAQSLAQGGVGLRFTLPSDP